MSPRLPQVGEPAPWFRVRSTSNERYSFDTVGGRYVVLCFFASAADPTSRAVVEAYVTRHRYVFDDEKVCFFGVSVDPNDQSSGALTQRLPGIRYFWDFDLAVSQLFGYVDGAHYARMSVVLDERLRIYAVVPFDTDPDTHVARVVEIVGSAPAFDSAVDALIPAPVLVLPRIFEPQLCQRLIEYYNEGSASDSGFMRDIDGKTTGINDHSHKRRSDKHIDDTALRNVCMARIKSRVVPEIHKAFQFHANRIERHIVACYDGDVGGHFRAHRDNTTKGTAHRRFAVSLVLNTGEFEGGLLRFPEFGRHTYNPPAGGAVVFSCSLLHEATPVTRGLRYCYLPFLYDDAAAQIRQQNQDSIVKDDRRAPQDEARGEDETRDGPADQ